MQTLSELPVAVIGAGPVGLAAAAHLVQRGFTPLVIEASGSVAGNLASYRHVRLFSPWQYNMDRAARTLLAGSGWTPPALDQLPTAGEIIDAYLAPLAALPSIAPHIHYGLRVTAVTRRGMDKVRTAGREETPFLIQAEAGGAVHTFLAQAVIDASGTWSQQNPLGVNGVPAQGEQALAARIRYGMPDIAGADRARYLGKRVLVVGAGHSAAGSLLALAELAQDDAGTSLVWAVRSTNLMRVFGGGEADQLRARGALGERLRALRDSGRLEMHENFRIHRLELSDGKVRVHATGVDGAEQVIEGIDEIVSATGARPAPEMTRELRVRLDPWLESTDALAPLIDPNLHSCGTVRPHGHRELAHPERNYYAVGAKSYGRAPNFLMATGYEQVRSVVAALAGDMASADDVQLELPETGVCNTRPYDAATPAAACCGGPAPVESAACCVLDATEKAAGKPGCGCGSAPARSCAAA